MMERFVPPVEHRQETMQELRTSIHERMSQETKLRVEKNPIPTEEELTCGAFREMIEPQVRDAVFEIRRRGYSCESSGFRDADGSAQSLDGFFVLDKETKERLLSLGVDVHQERDGSADYTSISWKADAVDERVLKDKWDRIVSSITDKGESAGPSINGDHEESFVAKYAPARTDMIQNILQRRIELVGDQTDPKVVEQWQKKLDSATKLQSPEDLERNEQIENDRQRQVALSAYLMKLDDEEVLRSSLSDRTDENPMGLARSLEAMDLEHTRSLTPDVVARVMFDVCSSDMERRGMVGDERIKIAINNYLVYAEKGELVAHTQSDIAMNHYVSSESDALMTEITDRRIELLSHVLGDERARINGLHDHLAQWWNDETIQKRIAAAESQVGERATAGPDDFLASAERVADMSMEKSLPGAPQSLAEVRQRVQTQKALTEARETLEETMLGNGDAFAIRGGRSPYVEGVASAGRARMEELVGLRVRVQIDALRNEALSYFRKQNLRVRRDAP